MILEVPPAFHLARSLVWKPMYNTMRAPRSLSGATQRSNMSGGTLLWMATAAEATLRTNSHHRQWRAMEALLQGGVRLFTVPRCDPRLIPWPIVDGKPVTSADAVTHSDGTTFSDGTGYAGRVIVASVSEDAAAAATELTIQVDRAGPFLGGEMFAIHHATQGWRLYTIAQITSAPAAVLAGTGAGEMTVRLGSPLWEAVSAGQALEFNRPRCTMLLRDNEDLALTVQDRRWGQAGIVFLEAPVSN